MASPTPELIRWTERFLGISLRPAASAVPKAIQAAGWGRPGRKPAARPASADGHGDEMTAA